jgi:uncharacterized protein (UPF0210 family)
VEVNLDAVGEVNLVLGVEVKEDEELKEVVDVAEVSLTMIIWMVHVCSPGV